MGPCSHANIFPVRPNPVITSSAISNSPYRSHSSRSMRSIWGFQTSIPPAACNIGSTITAAISSQRDRSRSSNSVSAALALPSLAGSREAR